jgi:hypothetical protein
MPMILSRKRSERMPQNNLQVRLERFTNTLIVFIFTVT